MYKFSEELRATLIKHYKTHYNAEVSQEEADLYLDSLGRLYNLVEKGNRAEEAKKGLVDPESAQPLP